MGRIDHCSVGLAQFLINDTRHGLIEPCLVLKVCKSDQHNFTVNTLYINKLLYQYH